MIKRTIRGINTALLVLLIGLLSWGLFGPVDVLTNWTITVPDKVYVGKQFNVESKLDKVKPVVGHSYRAVECQNKDGNPVSYPLNGALANRDPEESGTHTYSVMIDNIVPDLPASCVYTVNVCYNINFLRNFCEFNHSNRFTLYPKEVSVESTPAPVQSTPTPTKSEPQQTTTNNNSSVSSPEPVQDTIQYKDVCEPIIDLLGIKIGSVDCHQEQVS